MSYGRRTIILFVAASAAALACACQSTPRKPEAAPSRASPAPSATGAPNAEQTKVSSAASAPAPAQTADERRATLDKQLDASLGDLDSQLKREQERIARERDARGAGGTNESLAELGGDAASSADENAGAAVPGEESRPRSRSGDLRSDRANAASSAPGNNGAAARAVPDGNDDDIIARRLRRAFEQETDPELKEKLWKEYIEYRQNAQAR